MNLHFLSFRQNKLLKFCLAAGALTAAVARVDAQIVVTNMNNTVVFNAQSYFKFNSATGAVYSDNGNGYAFYVNSSSMMGNTGRVSTFNDTWFRPTDGLLNAGSDVSAAAFTTQFMFGQNQTVTSVANGYVGLRFDTTGGDTSDAYYGWLRFSYSDGVGITLHEFAMQTQANVAIMAGQTSAVPEPATVATLMGLAVGAITLVVRRRHRSV